MHGCVKRAAHCPTIESKEIKRSELQLRLFIGKDRKQSKKTSKNSEASHRFFSGCGRRAKIFVSVVISTIFEEI